MQGRVVSKWRRATGMFVGLMALIIGMSRLQAQSAAGSIQGVVLDPRGQAVQGGAVAVASSTGVVRTAVSGADRKSTVSVLTAGTFAVKTSSTGFGTDVRNNVAVAAGQTASVSVSLVFASVSEEVTVEAEADTSIAAQLAPVKALPDMASPRSQITSQYIREFTTPVTHFSDITPTAPGTVSYSTTGVGTRPAKAWFRGFTRGEF